jgi:hypothetical protein
MDVRPEQVTQIDLRPSVDFTSARKSPASRSVVELDELLIKRSSRRRPSKSLEGGRRTGNKAKDRLQQEWLTRRLAHRLDRLQQDTQYGRLEAEALLVAAKAK